MYEGLPAADDWRSFLLGLQGTDCKALKLMLGYDRQLAKRALGRLLHEKRQAFQIWLLEQLEQHHAKGIFAMIREPARLLQRAKKGIWHAGVVTEPLELAAHRRLEWLAWWNRGAMDTMDVVRCLDRLRARAQREALPPVQGDQLAAALYTFNDKTGKGLDDAGPSSSSTCPQWRWRPLLA